MPISTPMSTSTTSVRIAAFGFWSWARARAGKPGPPQPGGAGECGTGRGGGALGALRALLGGRAACIALGCALYRCAHRAGAGGALGGLPLRLRSSPRLAQTGFHKLKMRALRRWSLGRAAPSSSAAPAPDSELEFTLPRSGKGTSSGAEAKDAPSLSHHWGSAHKVVVNPTSPINHTLLLFA
jgi:hypothetical protein